MARSIGDLVFHLVLIGLAGFFLLEAYDLPSNAAGGSLPPAFFPKVLSALIAGLLLISLLKGLLKGKYKPKGQASRPSIVKPLVAWSSIVILIAVYASLIETGGYVITTTVFIFGCVSVISLMTSPVKEVLTVKNSVLLALFSLVVSLFIFLVFSLGFEVILPTIGVMGI